MFKTSEKVQKLTELEKLNQILDTFIMDGCTVGKLGDLEIRVVIMTPVLAKNILDTRNTSNRKLTISNVKLLTKMMNEGK